MKKALRCGKAISAALFVLLLVATGTKNALAQSTVGTDFWVTFLPNFTYNSEVTISLIAAAPTPCSGTVTNPYTNWSTTFEVSVGATTIIDIPLSEAYDVGSSDCVLNTGLHVVSTDSISLYASNFKQYTFDVTDVLPTPSLGSNYIIQTYPGVETSGRSTLVGPTNDSRNLATSSSEFTVVAVEDNTTVYINLTENSMNGHYANQPFSVTLDAGQCYQVKSLTDGNLTGSQISVSGNKKVAVFAGNSCANVPTNCSACDHIFEQMLPVSCWGNHFVVTGSSSRSYDVVRVTALNDDCQIFINNSLVSTIGERQTYQFEIYSDNPSVYLETSEPASVYMYYTGSNCGGENGDPSMVLISPIEQRMNNVTFSTFNSGVSQYHFVNVIANTDEVAYMQLDGNNIASEFQVVSGNPEYSFARVSIQHGSHTLSATEGGFVAHVYGFGWCESYAYSVGSRAINLSTQMIVNDQLASDFPDGFDICISEPVNFDINANFEVTQAYWDFGDGQTGTGSSISHQYDELGDYMVSCDVYRLKNGENILVATLTSEVHVYDKYNYEFVETALDSYTWDWTGETYTESGDYFYNGQTIHGCDSTATLHLTITEEINHWTPECANYPAVMSLFGIIQIDGVEQFSDQLEIGVFCGDECRGMAIATEYFFTHRYLVIMTICGNLGQQFSFKLYDHSIGQELDLTPPPAVDFITYGYGNPIDPYILNFTSKVPITAIVDPEGAGTVTGQGNYSIGATCTLEATANPGYQFLNWTLDGVVVSTDPAYEFTVTEAAEFVAHFLHVHVQSLAKGWNWWSTYIEQDGIDGLEMLENSVGPTCLRIQGRNAVIDQFEYEGNYYWYGTLDDITNEEKYMLLVSSDCDVVMVGEEALPANHPITINYGWNWIGFPCSQSVSLDVAMSGFTPENHDIIKSRSGAAMYANNSWHGSLNTFEPGKGYRYKSNSDVSKTLVYQTGRGERVVEGNSQESKIFTANAADFVDNMLVTAVVELDGQELRSEDYEVAAFVGDECRGSARLMYVEPFDRYVAFLLVFGESTENIHFVLTNGRNAASTNDHLTYTIDGMEGTLTEPTVLHFGVLGVDDCEKDVVNIFPNPSNGVFNVEGNGVQKIEVTDIYGQVIISEKVESNAMQIDLSGETAGVYLLRVITNKGITTRQLMKE